MDRTAPATRRGRLRTIVRAVPIAGALTVGIVASGGALLLGACGNSGLALARQACVHVDASIRYYTRSQDATSPAKATADKTRATKELESALPLAAAATSDDPQWNPLMTTLKEVGRNSESHLLQALRAQCTQADLPNEQAPVIAPVPVSHPTPGTPSPSTLPGQ